MSHSNRWRSPRFFRRFATAVPAVLGITTAAAVLSALTIALDGGRCTFLMCFNNSELSSNVSLHLAHLNFWGVSSFARSSIAGIRTTDDGSTSAAFCAVWSTTSDDTSASSGGGGGGGGASSVVYQPPVVTVADQLSA